MAALLQQGVSKDKILGDIRENGMEGEAFKRYHLTDMKDLSNISRAFGRGEVQRSENDQESVWVWIQEWQESENNPVLFYKLQGETAPEDLNLLQEDFFIVIQTPFQKAMAQKFTSKGVCIDTTHGTTGYDFLLTTVMVTDECGEGLPVAWFLSNHEDFTHMCLFFKLLRENCGQLSPHWLMSDTASQFYNAWVAIMGGTPIRLICIWHVDRAWKQELRAKVKDSEMAEDIYKMLRTVMQATTVPEFKTLLCKLEECLASISVEISNYFEREWLRKKEMWAYCYRVGLGINTNMIVEAFHRGFKYNYLKGKCNKRVDNCLLSLLKFVRDKYFERLIKLTKGKCNYKMRVIQDRHNKSKGLREEMITKVDNCKWSVQSDDSQTSNHRSVQFLYLAASTRCCIFWFYLMKKRKEIKYRTGKYDTKGNSTLPFSSFIGNMKRRRMFIQAVLAVLNQPKPKVVWMRLRSDAWFEMVMRSCNEQQRISELQRQHSCSF